MQKLTGLLQHLVDENLIDETLAQQVVSSTRPLETLIHEHHLCPEAVLHSCAKKFKLPIIHPELIESSAFIKNRLAAKFLAEQTILIAEGEGSKILFITADPFQHQALELLKFQSQRPVEIHLAHYQKIKECLHKHYHQHHEPATKEVLTEKEDTHLENDPLVTFLQQTLTRAYERKASDIHCEPFEQHYRIRYREDGLLHTINTSPAHIGHRIASRLKVMAHCDIAEKRIPQDGRFQLKITPTKEIDCRLSTCPTVHGEKIVVRLLNNSQQHLNIDALGLLPQQKEIVLETLKKPQGMILVTGPTGSGKTISLYTMLSLLNVEEKNISSVENPVEIRLEGINQVNINPKANLTFASALRAFLRQDPDILMVGEIRDTETADIAIKAAQTGHLVLSTLHTNSAIDALTRLYNIGIEKFNIVNALTLVIAQRLVRKLCPHCKQSAVIDDALCERYKMNTAWSRSPHFIPGECRHCTQGYRGRIGVYEILPIDKTLAELFLKGALSDALLEHALLGGYSTMLTAGFEKVKEGVTSVAELYRVIQ